MANDIGSDIARLFKTPGAEVGQPVSGDPLDRIFQLAGREKKAAFRAAKQRGIVTEATLRESLTKTDLSGRRLTAKGLESFFRKAEAGLGIFGSRQKLREQIRLTESAKGQRNILGL